MRQGAHEIRPSCIRHTVFAEGLRLHRKDSPSPDSKDLRLCNSALIRCSQRLAKAGILPSVGDVSSSYHSALAETITGPFRKRCIVRRDNGNPLTTWCTQRLIGSRGSIAARSCIVSAISRRQNWSGRITC